MDTIELSYEEKCDCTNDRFCSFVEQNEFFTEVEVKHLQQTILRKNLSKVLYVSATLAVWSMLAAWIDAAILPLVLVYTITLPGAVYYALLFPVVWTIINAVFKFAFIRRRLKGSVNLKDNLVAVFPYVGAVYLLKDWVIGDALLRKASLAYVKHQKKLAVQKAFGFLK